MGGDRARIDNGINTTRLDLSTIDTEEGIDHAKWEKGNGRGRGNDVELELHVDS